MKGLLFSFYLEIEDYISYDKPKQRGFIKVKSTETYLQITLDTKISFEELTNLFRSQE